jgi:myo-inositol-1(or 4)-monophosphatase
MSPADPAELLTLAVDMAAEAAELISAGLLRTRTSIDTKTTGTDMVTEMDHASEALILERITAARPDDAVLGEEGTDRIGTSGVRWVIDPIDGTTNYVYGHAGFAVSIAAQIDDKTTVGVVHDPLHRDVFAARRGHGATCNDEPIRCSAETEISRALVATGFAYDPDRRRRQGAVLTELLPIIRDIRRMGAASVDLCSVACGRVDAYYERGLQPWDHAAGALIASEAGAVVGNLRGGPVEFDFCLAAPPALFAALRDLLIAFDAGEA